MRNRISSTNSTIIFFQKIFLNEKLNNWIGFLIVSFIAILFAYLASANIYWGATALGVVIGICSLTVCIISPELGLYLTAVYVFFLSALPRFFYFDLPVGVGADILVFTAFIGLFISKKNLKENTVLFFKKKPVIFFAIILAFLVLELVNPLGHSFIGWFQVMRKIIQPAVVIFIGYNVFDSVSKIRRFVGFLFLIALITAIYGCFQQWHGLLKPEIDWVNADPARAGLIFIWGDYRKFSFFGGPTEFGVLMASCSLFFMLLGLNKKGWVRLLLIGGSAIMALSMSYSGTRTANAMLAAGIVMFLLLTINKKSSRVFAIFAVLLFLFIMRVPIYTNVTLYRFRTTFSASEDASYNVRESNRQTVQPFIWSHPIGGGLSTTGDMGKKYNPGHPMAGFPTDSSYLNKALESGWVGLTLTLLLYFSLLQYIVRGYFTTRNAEFKSFFAASLAFFFSIFVGEMTQEAVGVYGNLVVYYPVFAVVLRLREFSDNGGLS
jgi:putative inorganic carbon (hco3(-)) transporter